MSFSPVRTALNSPIVGRCCSRKPRSSSPTILDPQFGLDISGPVGRLLDAGAHAYLPPRPLELVAESVQMYLAGRVNGALGSSPPSVRQLNS
jgi:hypothetical protein